MPFVRSNAKMSGTKSMCLTYIYLAINSSLDFSRVGRNKAFRALAKNKRFRQIAGNATTRYAWVVLFRPTRLLGFSLAGISPSQQT